ncbi:hypothetical protein OPV22_028041 [Ensete ventricosum]|uniref:Uncharacterized protein n=1 Tax=Ensete ventricosum TaxID=4639 RepID=A0AAV8Q9D5_ENSVE|nr:hypothetical protein OPV22_028041 [Ensete ventricosum]
MGNAGRRGKRGALRSSPYAMATWQRASEMTLFATGEWGSSTRALTDVQQLNRKLKKAIHGFNCFALKCREEDASE